MNNTGIHRVTADSKRGRQMVSGGTILGQVMQSEAIRIWNMDVEARKAQKENERRVRRGLNRERDAVAAMKAAA